MLSTEITKKSQQKQRNHDFTFANVHLMLANACTWSSVHISFVSRKQRVRHKRSSYAICWNHRNHQQITAKP